MNYLRKTAATARPNSELRKASDILHVDGMYLVNLTNGKGAAFTGFTPADMSITINSAWTAPYADTNLIGGVGDLVGGQAGGIINAADKASRGVGVTQFQRSLSGKLWSEPQWLTLDLPIFLHAQGDAREDVTRKTVASLKAVTPSEGPFGLLVAPGPIPAVQVGVDALNQVVAVANNFVTMDNIAPPSQMDEAFTLTIGNFFVMYPCIVTNINAKVDGRFQDGNGHPISADLMMTVESYFAVTKQDIDRWFKF